VRIWSLHPKYLDARGLVALWREGLLALAVLRGKTRGYTKHPQLERFRGETRPSRAMERYLWHVLREARARGYRFDAERIRGGGDAGRQGAGRQARPLRVTTGQLLYELEHLRRKLKARDPAKSRELRRVQLPEPHPLFRAAKGEVEAWERRRGP